MFSDIISEYLRAGFSPALLLIFSSILINLIILPIKLHLKKWTCKNQDRLDSMNEEIEGIKKYYIGMKQFYQIKAVKSRYNYTVREALKISMILIVQLPIFIIAYQAFHNNPIFNDVSFYFISDLSSPDRFLGGYNLLPVLMTLVNLLQILILKKYSSISDMTKMLGLPIIFLLLLYNYESSLLLFWTLNNIFSFGLSYVIGIRESWGNMQWNINIILYEIKKRRIQLLSLMLFLSLILLSYYIPVKKKFLSDIETLSGYISLCLSFILTFFVFTILMYPKLKSNIATTRKLLGFTFVLMSFLISFYFGHWDRMIVLYVVLSGFLLFKMRSSKLDLRPDYYLLITSFLLILLISIDYIKSNIVFFNWSTAIIFSAFFIFLFLIKYIILRTLVTHFEDKKTTMITVLSFSAGVLLLPKFTDYCKLQSENNIPLLLFLIIIFALLFNEYLKNKTKYVNRFLGILLVLQLVSLMYSVNSYSSMKAKANVIDLPDHLKNTNMKVKPSIYFLIYDAYQSAYKLNFNYGINNYKQENYLINNDFKLYEDRYTIYPMSAGSVGRMFDFKTGDFTTLDRYLQSQGYKTFYSFKQASSFQTRGFIFENSTQFPDPEKNEIDRLLEVISGVIQGEFKFDTKPIIKNIKKKSYLAAKSRHIRKSIDSPKFIYSHSPSPGHTQNSGVCLKNENKKFIKRLKKANKEMKKDIKLILKHDPDSIVVIAGDHGPYLTSDCHMMHSYPKSKVRVIDIDDRYSTFLAIRWPKKLKEEYGEIKILQDVFYEILSRTKQNSNIYKIRWEEKSLKRLGDCNQLFKGGFITCGRDIGNKLHGNNETESLTRKEDKFNNKI